MFGINQSKNAQSSASTVSTTDSNNDNSQQSHNTDNSVGAGAGGDVASNSNNKSNAVSGVTGNVTIEDASQGALSLASNATDRIADVAAAALGGAAQLGKDAFASQGAAFSQAAGVAGGRAPTDSKAEMVKYAAIATAAIIIVVFLKGRKAA